MAKGRKAYPLEYRRRLVEMFRAGRSAKSLARDFESPTSQPSIKPGELQFGGLLTSAFSRLLPPFMTGLWIL
jgi:hypothetical protein